MSRPTRVQINPEALKHNVGKIRQLAPHSQLIAMVKANAYGCGVAAVVPVLDPLVDAFGVACMEEAMAIRHLDAQKNCILFQGIFTADELEVVSQQGFEQVIHQPYQLNWLLSQPLAKPVKVWVKVNTGMHRLGFALEEVPAVLNALNHCPWVDKKIGVLTHLASSDELDNPSNKKQLQLYQSLALSPGNYRTSIANSAAILSNPRMHMDAVRPGIMLYGASPFSDKTAQQLDLQPVSRFISAISAIHDYPAGIRVGYNGTWQSTKETRIAVVAAGYGDGYPRHIAANTPVAVHNQLFPIVGRVSMDMLTIDITDAQIPINIGDIVELWGPTVPIEKIASQAGTIAYELMCQLSPRVKRD